MQASARLQARVCGLVRRACGVCACAVGVYCVCVMFVRILVSIRLSLVFVRVGCGICKNYGSYAAEGVKCRGAAVTDVSSST